MFELSTLADRREKLMRRFFDQLKRPDNCLAHLMPAKRELLLINYLRHARLYLMNFRKRELLDTQNLLIPFYILNTERYLHHSILFTIFHFIIVFNPGFGCNIKKILFLCYAY